jgi:deoxyribodipyrimidine photo-lyase
MQNNWIHRPWQATARALGFAGVELGADYPRPIVEHNVEVQKARAMYRRARDS